jgi:cytochrome b561
MGDRHIFVEVYSGVAKLLHWLVAACVLFIIPVGVIMQRLGPGEVQNALYNLHRSFGFLVLILMVVRLAYRSVHGAPKPEPTLNAFQRVASVAVHHVLYALLLVQPVVGWLATSAYGAPIWVFGMFRLPDLLSKNEALSKTLFLAHNVMALVIAGLLTLHIAAAFYHFLIRRDQVMQRMLP